jgi:hypothetical protein
MLWQGIQNEILGPECIGCQDSREDLLWFLEITSFFRYPCQPITCTIQRISNINNEAKSFQLWDVVRKEKDPKCKNIQQAGFPDGHPL